ncbi:MAG TPA: hypothetical protein VLV55_10075 [Rhizomicrobium sp.]|nr:hypothetical protein [Rhizomicrobium sp.]
MTAEATSGLAPKPVRPFAPYCKSDRNFFLTYVVLIWFGILGGFVPEIVSHIAQHKPPFPWIVHVHAVVFVGWLVVLTTQVLLIRNKRADLHRRLGVAAMGLAAVMVVVGPATAIIMQRYHWGTPDSDPPFLAIQGTDILAFAGLAAAAFVWRNNSSAHKRLILLATLYISDAGFARFFGDGVHGLLGDGFWPFLAEAYLANDVLAVGIGVYDFATRKALHPAYVAGMAWTFGLQLIGSALYHAPAWKPVALALIGH